MFFSVFLLSLVFASHIQDSECIATMAIDLGSEFMKVAIVKPGVPMEIALDRESQRKTPTVVSMRNDERHFGTPALGLAVKHPSQVYQFIPSIVGKHLDHPVVQLFLQRFPYHNLREDKESGQLVFQHDNKTEYTAEELLAMLLQNAREIAEKFSDFPMKSAVIAVPCHFTQAERRAVKRAASIAGLDVLQLMSSNAAVALNYGIFRRKDFNSTAQYYMFYDLGAMSSTATIVSYQIAKSWDKGVMEENPQLKVIGVGVDPTLGSTAFILRLRDHLAKAFNNQKLTKIDVTKDHRAMAKLTKEAGRVFRVLSANNDIIAQIENLLEDRDFKLKVTRAELEDLCADLIERIAQPLHSALEAAQIPITLIREVILMGGGTRMPKVQETLVRLSKKSELGKSVNSDEAAALGAVYQAAYRSPGFRVKTFGVMEATLYPVVIEFPRIKGETESGTQGEGQTTIRSVRRFLFNLMNVYPQKKMITFNKQFTDMTFTVKHADVPELLHNHVGELNLTSVTLLGVAEAHLKHTVDARNNQQQIEGVEAKGVKAHFKMDESGLVHLISVEAVFEKSPVVIVAEQSAFQKLGSTISNLFGGGSSGSEDHGKPTPLVADQTEQQKAGAADQEGDRRSGPTESAGKSVNQSSIPSGGTGGAGGQQQNATEATPGAASGNGTTSAGTGAEATKNATKPQPSKRVPVSEPIKFTITHVDMPEPSEETIKTSMKKIAALKAADEAKQALEKSKNELESYIFEARDRLGQADYVRCSTEAEREKLVEEMRLASDWYEEQGLDTGREVYVQKLSGLRQQMKDLEFRVVEMRGRPEAFKKLDEVLNGTQVFYETMVNMTTTTKIFTQTEIDSLSKLINDTKSWIQSAKRTVERMDLAARPTLVVEDINGKVVSMEREMLYFLNKINIWRSNPPPPTSTPTPTPTNASEEQKIPDGAGNTTGTLNDGDAKVEDEPATDSANGDTGNPKPAAAPEPDAEKKTEVPEASREQGDKAGASEGTEKHQEL